MLKNNRQKKLFLWEVASVCIMLLTVLFVYWIYQPADSVLHITDLDDVGITDIHSRKNQLSVSPFSFRQNAVESGIEFYHFPFQRGSLIVEDMGSGVAWGDYDRDGDPDLFLVNFFTPLLAPSILGKSKTLHTLYQNQGDGTFVDVSTVSGIDTPSYGMGAAWGDYDNDDDLDLYISNYGENFLFQNNGDGTFCEVAKKAGVNDNHFSTGCMWGDYDRDGWIDLYVCNYVEFVFREADRNRKSQFKRAEYPYTLNPSSYSPQPNSLYRNNQDGTFTNVAEELDVHNPDGRSLCVAWADFDLDGWIDIYIANDVSNNALYRNRGDGTFEDISSSSLTADYRGAMGIAIGDFDRDLDLDMFITHWLAQENALYQNMYSLMASEKNVAEPLFFTDSADEYGLGQISLDMVGWSTSFADFDNDGLLDLWVSNGNTLEDSNNAKQLIPQKLFLFWQKQGQGFIDVSINACQELSQPMVARGGAFADVNNDGLLDFAIQQHGSSLLLFQNITKNKNHWIQFQLKQHERNTQALGARVVIETSDGLQMQQVGSQGSYLSQNQNILHFGLGEDTYVDKVHIAWPDGEEEVKHRVEGNKKIVYTHQPQY